jgi:pyruvate/2-oxoglutarate dehydrogenase complex dihydrolipoamide dehydrogenase (E3) component
MKVKCYRESGNPVDVEALKEHKKEFQVEYDVIMAAHGKDMKVVHEKLEELDVKLEAKYETILDVEFPSNSDEILKFLNVYGPYMVAEHKEREEILIIIKDIGA